MDTSKDYVYTPEKALKEVFGSDAINGTVENLLKSSQAYKITSDGINAAGGSGGGWGADHTITEFDPAIYDGDGIGASCDGHDGRGIHRTVRRASRGICSVPDSMTERRTSSLFRLTKKKCSTSLKQTARTWSS